MAEARLTLKMLDEIMEQLKPAPYWCVAGFRHEASTGCLHTTNPIARRLLKEALRAGLFEEADR
jgi:hypothetical protein